MYSNSTAFVTLTRGRLKRGVLDLLPHLPLDVLCEIFCFLCPVDLLVLARTAKLFRRFLLGRSAAFIWRAARRNVDGLPEPPSDMSEIQYASLLFGFGCHYQGCEKKARDIVWHLRIRSCTSCRSKHQPVKANECTDYLAVCEMLAFYPDALEQYIPCGPFLGPKGNLVKGLQEQHIKAFADELRALPTSKRQNYLGQCKQTAEAVGKFASAGVAWQLKAKNMRTAEMRNKRMARAEIIRENLITAGFNEEIEYFGWDRISKHSLINKTQALTDKASSGILDQLKEYMLGWREVRMEEQVYAFRRRTFIEAWLHFTSDTFRDASRCCPYLPLPPNATVGFFESIDSIIRQPGSLSTDSLLQQLRTAFPPALHDVLEWHKTVRREIASLLPEYMADDDDEAVHARLKLATSVFHCTGRNCRGESRPMAYPEILFHPCFTLVTHGNGPSARDPRSIARQRACLVMGGPWSCKGRVEVHPRRDVVNNVLQYCGRDSVTTTAAEMDSRDPRLVCPECASRDKVITFMSWRCAIQHSIMFHPDSTRKQPWFMASDNTRLQIIGSGLRVLRSFTTRSGLKVGDHSVCLQCPPRIPSWNTRFGFEDLLGHLKDQHSILSPVFGKHYAFDLNATPTYLDFEIPRK